MMVSTHPLSPIADNTKGNTTTATNASASATNAPSVKQSDTRLRRMKLLFSVYVWVIVSLLHGLA